MECNVENRLVGPNSVGANEKLETNEEATAISRQNAVTWNRVIAQDVVRSIQILCIS